MIILNEKRKVVLRNPKYGSIKITDDGTEVIPNAGYYGSIIKSSKSEIQIKFCKKPICSLTVEDYENYYLSCQKKNKKK